MVDDSADPILDRILARVRRDVESGDLVRAMRLVLTFGAAMNDASPVQRQRLSRRGQPLLDHLRETGETAPLYRLIHEVLGADWRPTGDAAEWIDKLGKK